MATEHLSGRVRLHWSSEEPVELPAEVEMERGLAVFPAALIIPLARPASSIPFLPLSTSDVTLHCYGSPRYYPDATGQRDDVTSALYKGSDTSSPGR